jgi:dihydrofolate reductase
MTVVRLLAGFRHRTVCDLHQHHAKIRRQRHLAGSQLASSTLISHDVAGAIANLKAQPGKAICVHGISLVQSLLLSGALDELRLTQVPAIAGSGRRLLEHGGPPIQLDLQSSRSTRTGLNYLVLTPQR